MLQFDTAYQLARERQAELLRVAEMARQARSGAKSAIGRPPFLMPFRRWLARVLLAIAERLEREAKPRSRSEGATQGSAGGWKYTERERRPRRRSVEPRSRRRVDSADRRDNARDDGDWWQVA